MYIDIVTFVLIIRHTNNKMITYSKIHVTSILLLYNIIPFSKIILFFSYYFLLKISFICHSIK